MRTSPFYDRQVALGAQFWEAGFWERPAWFEANQGLLDDLVAGGFGIPERDSWSARHWSPISVAEAAHTRSHVALYDMTPLTRYELSGPGALDLLQQLTTNNLDKSVGSVTYTLMLDEKGGVRSDLTVARLADDVFQVGANGPVDFDWIARHLPTDGVTLRDITGAPAASASGAIGAGGAGATDTHRPHQRGAQVLPVRTDDDRPDSGHADAGVLRRRTRLGDLHRREYGRGLWDLLMTAGHEHRIIPAGRIAFNALRIEKATGRPAPT